MVSVWRPIALALAAPASWRAPVSQSRLGRIHLVHDGHRRVSVARVLGLASITALALLAVTPVRRVRRGAPGLRPPRRTSASSRRTWCRKPRFSPSACVHRLAAGSGPSAPITVPCPRRRPSTLRPARGRLPVQRAPLERDRRCIQGAGHCREGARRTSTRTGGLTTRPSPWIRRPSSRRVGGPTRDRNRARSGHLHASCLGGPIRESSPAHARWDGHTIRKPASRSGCSTRMAPAFSDQGRDPDPGATTVPVPRSRPGARSW